MFYGWTIVGVTFFTNFVSVGFLFYSYGVFFKALQEEFGGGRLGVAAGITVMNVVTAVGAPALGRWIDTGSMRTIMSLGALLMAAGFLAASQIEQLWQLYVVLGSLLGLGALMLGGLASSTLVANWFVARRGTALGIATMGVSLSGVVMAPLATWLIDRIGWRATFWIYAAVALFLVIPIVWRFIVSRPEDLGLIPDGDGATDESAQPPLEPMLPLAPGDQMTDHPAHIDWSARGVLRDRNFLFIALAVSLNFCAMGAVLTHIVPHATDLGFEKEQAALVLSVIAGVGVLGKLLFGWITDRIDKRLALYMCAGLQAAGIMGLLDAERYLPLLGAGAIFGLGMGGLVPIHGSMIGAAFGRHAFGRIMGLMFPTMLPIQLIGVPYAGWVFDTRGSYDLAFMSFLGAYALAVLFASLLRLPDVEPGHPAAPA